MMVVVCQNIANDPSKVQPTLKTWSPSFKFLLKMTKFKMREVEIPICKDQKNGKQIWNVICDSLKMWHKFEMGFVKILKVWNKYEISFVKILKYETNMKFDL